MKFHIFYESFKLEMKKLNSVMPSRMHQVESKLHQLQWKSLKYIEFQTEPNASVAEPTQKRVVAKLARRDKQNSQFF